ncbi:hypothetical protein [Streptomyces spiralis]|uniref:hypothetical protein n=1 Tax=Streptomyces spiralis TaxID=66376 RepID=UPI0036AB273F
MTDAAAARDAPASTYSAHARCGAGCPAEPVLRLAVSGLAHDAGSPAERLDGGVRGCW